MYPKAHGMYSSSCPLLSIWATSGFHPREKEAAQRIGGKMFLYRSTFSLFSECILHSRSYAAIAEV